MQLLEETLGKNFLNIFKNRHPHEWLQFLTNFERAKKAFKPDEKSKISLTLPYTMGVLFAEMNSGKTHRKTSQRICF